MRFAILKDVTLNITIMWDATLSSPLTSRRAFQRNDSLEGR
jgi:hypothetical protein